LPGPGMWSQIFSATRLRDPRSYSAIWVRKARPFTSRSRYCQPSFFVAAFFAVLYHYGVMQWVIRQMARVMMKFMGTSGAESMNVAASIFLGCTEAPLTIRPFLETADALRVDDHHDERHGAHQRCGDGGLHSFWIPAKHLLTAVIMTAPGTILIAKMLMPETEQPVTAGRVAMSDEEIEGEHTVKPAGGNRKGHDRRPLPDPECCRDADLVLALIALADGHSGWRPQWPRAFWMELVSDQLRADFRRGFFSDCLGDWRAVEKTVRRLATCLARAWCSTNSWPFRAWAVCSRCSIRAPI